MRRAQAYPRKVMSARDLLLEIGCEELPSSFVDSAVVALPDLAKRRLDSLRLDRKAIRALGTPRRLVLLVEGLAEAQPDLDEEVMGPPVRAAFKDGVPTRAAVAFAEKLGVSVEALSKVDTPKGEYLKGTRKESGRPTEGLLPALLEAIVKEIPFRKSMRWGDLDFAFGRPIQWVVALFGDQEIPLEIASKKSSRTSRGHRFLSPGGVTISDPGSYVQTMRDQHVLVVPEERRAALKVALENAVAQIKGTLIEDDFLMDENCSLVEEPFVVVGSFEDRFLELPERVILAVAKGHQRYFGVRRADGSLYPGYLAVVNTALEPKLIATGNDRVMRARLSDARFFYTEDTKIPLAKRREKLAGVVFQKRLGSVLEKSDRVEILTGKLAEMAHAEEKTRTVATEGAHLAKCDLVSLMVGEFPELQGDMGASYAIAQGISPDVAAVVRDHYRPKGAADETAPTDAAALVAIADRLDTAVACFGIGLAPTGTADPFGLRRAVLGILRTLLDRGFDLSLAAMIRAAAAALDGKKLDLSTDELVAKISEFAGDRLRGVLSEKWPADAVRACIAAGHDRPIDLRRRVEALAQLDADTRAKVGEVFKRATNIAEGAPDGEPDAPGPNAHPSEQALFAKYHEFAMTEHDGTKSAWLNFPPDMILKFVATIAPVMHQYFIDVFVMDKDDAIRNNRLKLMRAISDRCARIARLELLVAT